jgi:predicted nuclease with TOPRIM domain
MAASLLSNLELLGGKIEELLHDNNALRVRNEEIEAENNDLRRQIADAIKERDRARLDCEYLAMSHKLADNPDTLVDTRRHFSKLIRNIDRCLEMLKE